MANKKTIVIDIDGVLCSEEKTHERVFATPIKQAITYINELVECGHTVILFTARSWAEFKITYSWLINNGVRFHSLVCGKPCGDFYVDDRSFRSMSELIDKIPFLLI